MRNKDRQIKNRLRRFYDKGSLHGEPCSELPRSQDEAQGFYCLRQNSVYRRRRMGFIGRNGLHFYCSFSFFGISELRMGFDLIHKITSADFEVGSNNTPLISASPQQLILTADIRVGYSIRNAGSQEILTIRDSLSYIFRTAPQQQCPAPPAIVSILNSHTKPSCERGQEPAESHQNIRKPEERFYGRAC